MRSDKVKQVKEKKQGIYITTEHGLMILIDDEHEKKLFRKALKEKKAKKLIKGKKDEEFLRKLVGLKVLEFEDLTQEKELPREYDLRLLNYDGSEPIHAAPIMAHLEIEKRCNLACKYCSVRKTHEKTDKMMSLEELKKVIDKFVEWGVGQITITGGEPLLRIDDVIELVKYENSIPNSPPISLSTNGTLLTEENVKKLSNAGLSLCQVSLDCHIPEVNDKLRGKGVCKKVIEGIKRLKKAGIITGVDCVVTSNNLEHIVGFVRFLDKLGVDYFTLLKLKPGALTEEEFLRLSPDPKEYAKVIRKIAEIQDEINIKVTLDCGSINVMQMAFTDQELKTVPVLGCPVGHTQIVINPDGDVYPCAALLGKEFLLGNVLKDDLEKIWLENPILKELRQVKKNIKEPCKSCKHLDICRGGCRGIAWKLLKDKWAPDPTCSINQRFLQ